MKKILLTIAALSMTSSLAMAQGISSRYTYGDASPPVNGNDAGVDFEGTASIDRPEESDRDAPQDPVTRDPAEISNESPD